MAEVKLSVLSLFGVLTDAENLGRQVAAELGGSPLAARWVADPALRERLPRPEWERVGK